MRGINCYDSPCHSPRHKQELKLSDLQTVSFSLDITQCTYWAPLFLYTEHNAHTGRPCFFIQNTMHILDAPLSLYRTQCTYWTLLFLYTEHNAHTGRPSFFIQNTMHILVAPLSLYRTQCTYWTPLFLYTEH